MLKTNIKINMYFNKTHNLIVSWNIFQYSLFCGTSYQDHLWYFFHKYESDPQIVSDDLEFAGVIYIEMYIVDLISGEYFYFWTLITMVVIIQLHSGSLYLDFSSSPESFHKS